MKNKFLLIAIVLFGALGIWFSKGYFEREKVGFKIIDRNSFSVSDPKFLNTEVTDKSLERKEHEQSLRNIDNAWNYIGAGDEHIKNGMLAEALDAYKKSYAIGGGARAVSGLLLADTYEKLGRYDEGIVLLDEMIAMRYLSKNGIRNANQIRSRLIAAKAEQ